MAIRMFAARAPARRAGPGGGYCPDGTWCPDGHHCLCHGVARDGTVGQGGYCECEPDELTYGEPSGKLAGMARRRFSLSARARQRAYAGSRAFARPTAAPQPGWDPFACPGQLNCGKDAAGNTICCDDCRAPLCGLALRTPPGAGDPFGRQPGPRRTLGISAGATGQTRATSTEWAYAGFGGPGRQLRAPTRTPRPRRWCPPGTAPIPSADGRSVNCIGQGRTMGGKSYPIVF